MSRRTVYVTSEGAVVRRRGERIRIVSRRKELANIPLAEIYELVLVGNITLTPAALGGLVDRGIDVVMLTHRGRFRGRIHGGVSSNVRLRLGQYDLSRDPAGSLELAKRIVIGKIRNQRAQLMRHARRHGDSDALAVARSSLRAAAMRAERVDSLDELRGCEGSASAAYFRVFGHMLRGERFSFDGRNRRPPLDPVNALLSLGYTLLMNVVEGAVRAVGLDPWLGTLHSPLAGRASLACDLVEEFRAPIVDALVVASINHGAFDPSDFEDVGPGEPVVMKPETVRWMLTLFERRMARRTAYEPLGVKLAWRQIIEQQARRYARHILREDAYLPYRMR